MSVDKNDFEFISEIIRQRRAIFPVQFTDEEIPEDIIDQLLELANWAPTHRRTEPWRYVVVSGTARERLATFLSQTYKDITPLESFNAHKQEKIINKCLRSQYILLICMQRDTADRVPEWEEIAAVAMSVQNIWLACTTLGIGSYWSTPAMKDHIRSFVPLAEGERCLGLFYIGSFHKERPDGVRTPMADRIRYLAQ